MTVVRGVLCDIDGTLVDSNDANAQAFVQAFQEYGLNIPFDKIRPLIGKGSDKLLPEVAGLDSESERGKKLLDRRKEIYLQGYVPHLKPTPGARELLEHLKNEKILIVAATSGEEETDAALKQAGLLDFLDNKASSKDASNSKPDPDIIQAALERGGLKADECVMLGDTPYDLEAANNAGVPAIALLTGGWKPEDLAQAVAIYATPADLLTHFEEAFQRK